MPAIEILRFCALLENLPTEVGHKDASHFVDLLFQNALNVLDFSEIVLARDGWQRVQRWQDFLRSSLTQYPVGTNSLSESITNHKVALSFSEIVADLCLLDRLALIKALEVGRRLIADDDRKWAFLEVNASQRPIGVSMSWDLNPKCGSVAAVEQYIKDTPIRGSIPALVVSYFLRTGMSLTSGIIDKGASSCATLLDQIENSRKSLMS